MANAKNSPRKSTAKDDAEWERLFELWKNYEEIAMHFNDLIIRVRIQALGGVAAVVAILLGLLGKKKEELELSWGALAAGFTLVLVMWIAIWILDFQYYYRLLRGAVSGIVDIERQTVEHGTQPEIILSREIEQAVWHKRWGHVRLGNDMVPQGRIEPGIWWFYGIVAFALGVCIIVCTTCWLRQ